MKRFAIPVSIIGCILFLIAALLPPTASGQAEPDPATPSQSQLDRSAISRLYFAAFDRPADLEGLDYWDEVHQSGVGLNQIAQFFVNSEEFSNTYGEVDDERFVELVYQNVLGRPADEEGLTYWVQLLQSGHTSGTVLNGFAQSPEFERKTGDEVLEPTSTFPGAVLMIGDSIFHGIRLLDIPVGTAELSFLTEEGRQVTALAGLVASARENGQLDGADVIVIHLGTNGWLDEYDAMFDSQVAALAPRPVLVVNTEVDRPWESIANDRIGAVAARHGHVNLVDWNRTVAPHPEWMRADGVHPNSDGLTGLAEAIAARLAETYVPRE